MKNVKNQNTNKTYW